MSSSPLAVFLSYSSDDAEVAARVASSLRTAGVEIWFDQSELRGGEVWDRAIRAQIRACTLFVPIVSSRTEARREGYFRLEWRLASERVQLMSADRPFLVPLVTDDVAEASARVPDCFHEVQWTRLGSDEELTLFAARVVHLLGQVESGGQEAAVKSIEDPRDRSGTDRARPDKRKRHWSRSLGFVGASSLLVLAAAGLYAYLDSHRAVVPYSAADRRMTFAVMPFQSDPADPVSATIAQNAREGLSRHLDEFDPEARALPLETVDAAIKADSSMSAIERALNVHFLIRGTVTPHEGGHEVRLNLFDVPTQANVYSFSLNVPEGLLKPRWESEFMMADDELRSGGVRAENARSAGRPDGDLDARDLLYRASVLAWNGQRTQAEYQRVQALLDRARTLAPDNVAVLGTLERTNLCSCLETWAQDITQFRAKGEAALDRALQLRPDLPWLRLDKIDYLGERGHWADALAIADQILSTNPGSFGAKADKTMALLWLGRPAEALPLAEQLAERDPSGENWGYVVAQSYFAVGRYAEAAKMARLMTASNDSDQTDSRDLIAMRLLLAAAEAKSGQVSLAKTDFASVQGHLPKLQTMNDVHSLIQQSLAVTSDPAFEEGLVAAGLRA